MRCDKYTLDRFEGDVGVLLLKGDESQELLVNKDQLTGANEGDILQVEFAEDDVTKVTVLEEETKAEKEKVQSLLDKLKNKK